MKLHYSYVSYLITVVFLAGLASSQPSTGTTTVNTTVSDYLSITFEYPEILVPGNYSFVQNVSVFQNSAQSIYVYLNKTDPNDFFKFVNSSGGSIYYQDNYTLYLSGGGTENVSARIFIPPGMGYNGSFVISVHGDSLNDSRTASQPLGIEVNNTNPVNKVQVLSIVPASLYSGQQITADISVHKTSPSKTSFVQVCYCVNTNPGYACGPILNNHGCEWRGIEEWMNFSKAVTVTQDPGQYYFISAVYYSDNSTIMRGSSTVFNIQSIGTSPPGGGPSGGGTPPSPSAVFNIIAQDFIESRLGDTVRFDVEVENIGNANASDTTLRIYGLSENWVSVHPSSFDIPSGSSKNFTVSISIPFDVEENLYTLSIVASSGTVEKTRDITFTIAAEAEDIAKFLLEEAESKKKKSDAIFEKTNEWMMITAPEP